MKAKTVKRLTPRRILLNSLRCRLMQFGASNYSFVRGARAGIGGLRGSARRRLATRRGVDAYLAGPRASSGLVGEMSGQGGCGADHPGPRTYAGSYRRGFAPVGVEGDDHRLIVQPMEHPSNWFAARGRARTGRPVADPQAPAVQAVAVGAVGAEPSGWRHNVSVKMRMLPPAVLMYSTFPAAIQL